MRRATFLLLFVLSIVQLADSPGAHAQGGVALPFAGKVALVTGSTDGLGREVARALATGGAHVIVHGRNVERGKALVEEISGEGKGSARFIAADLASLEAVRGLADSVMRLHPRLDLLVNNAGIAMINERERRTSVDGHELHFAVNYLAGWVLVHRLRPALEAAKPSRIINVASLSAAPIDFSDVMLERPGAVARGYGQSKLAQVMMTAELAGDFAKGGITMVALHPATMMNTNMVLRSGLPTRSTVEQGTNAVMHLISSPSLQAGAFYNGMRLATPHSQAADAEARARLRALSAQLTRTP